MFTAEGFFPVTIVEALLAEPKFNQNAAFDVCLKVQSVDNPAQADWWRGEWSQDYGQGNFATMTQAEITMKVLHEIGFEGSDLGTLSQQLVGKPTNATVKASPGRNGGMFYNVRYLGAGIGDQPKALDPATATARAQAMIDGGAMPAPAMPAATTPAAAPAAPAAPAATTPAAAAPAAAAPAAAAPAAAAPANPFAVPGA